ncbi:MAG TPA: glutamate 5-kinase [Dehalococcoidia bacterium]|nr:glutamate 5-kinase [Dehalococcoidia bacterium]
MSYKRLVAKFGTNLLTGGSRQLNLGIMSSLVEQVADLHRQGQEIIIVSSGAVAAGRQKLGITKERRDIPFKQVLASVGQSQLMNIYEQLFSKHNIVVAQALLTKADLIDRAGYLNARNTLLALLDLGVVCIVNENDVVATDELGELIFGDNDNLSAMVANLVDADLLVLLTDIEGLYTSDPQRNPEAKLIPRVEKIDAEIERLAANTSSPSGVGGMITKLEAAKLATASGVTVVIADGRKPDILKHIVQQENIGTVFPPRTTKLESKKRWLLSGLASRGKLTIDHGAVQALKKQNRSLLPAGVVDVSGEFQRGDVVEIFDSSGNHIGCGIPNYSARDIAIIKGAHSNAISSLLGYEYGTEVIHRNNMVLI